MNFLKNVHELIEMMVANSLNSGFKDAFNWASQS